MKFVRAKRRLKVVLLGSSPLRVEKGLSESLAGRFEVLHLPHWTFSEMRDAFGWSVDRYLYFGGYPGAAPLAREPKRWSRYVLDALVEPTISRDVLLLSRVDKPALLRRLFELGTRYSGQMLSYTKMLGQLVDSGNTTTLAHYLDLLAAAGMLVGIPKYAGEVIRQRASSPKLQVFNTALLSAASGLSPRAARADGETWGRLVESAVGLTWSTRRLQESARSSIGEIVMSRWTSWSSEAEPSPRSRSRVAGGGRFPRG